MPTNGATPASEPAVPAAAPAGWDKVETSTEDEPLEWGGVDYMVVSGEKPVSVAELVEQAGEPIEVAPAKPKAKRQRKPKADKPAKPADKAKSGNQAPKQGKGAEMIAALKQRWMPVPDLLKSTGWLPHTLRGYITCTAKAEGWTLERDRVDGVTRYRITV